MLQEFIDYLHSQIGQPYLWGGQHTKLTPDNYVSVIKKKEKTEKNAETVIAYCDQKWAEGAEILWGSDCSGLGMFFLQNEKHIYKSDMTANGMKGHCELTEELPKRGYWVFKCDKSGKATHIGYMVTDTELVEAKGRLYGVCYTEWKKASWSVWGIPDCFRDEIVTPVPPEPQFGMVEVIGASVNVRASDSKKGMYLFTAHRHDTFPLLGISQETGWYNIQTPKYPSAWISNRMDLTKVVER